MKVRTHMVVGRTAACLFTLVGPAAAIEVNPTQSQIQTALDRGRHAAAEHQAPETFYTRFGSDDSAQPKGFLLKKLGSLSVMATHMALRGLEPSAADVAQMVEAATMLVSATIVGESPDFAVNSYMILDQGGRAIKPVTVRADGQADRRTAPPGLPTFQAKVVATFRYDDFDPKARTTIMIFPSQGGEAHFTLNFADIQ